MRRLGLAFSLAVLMLRPGVAGAADLAGVVLPDTQVVADTRLVLNGAALRTYSLLAIRIYVAGLYLGQPTHDAAAILDSNGAKLLELHFLRDVPADQAQRAWRDDITANCTSPCAISDATLREYLAAVTDAHRGDVVRLLFAPPSMVVQLNQRVVLHTADPVLTRTVLASFLGEHPASQAVRRGLLGQP